MHKAHDHECLLNRQLGHGIFTVCEDPKTNKGPATLLAYRPIQINCINDLPLAHKALQKQRPAKNAIVDKLGFSRISLKETEQWFKCVWDH